jgi:hypothetical protein
MNAYRGCNIKMDFGEIQLDGRDVWVWLRVWRTGGLF